MATDPQQLASVQAPQTTGQELEGVYQSTTSHKVKWYLARHPNTSAALLDKLAKEESEDIRAGVARHENVTGELIASLSRDPSALVRQAVAESDVASASILERLASDKSAAVRSAVALALNTPPSTLERLCKDKVEEVRIAVATYELPEQLLALLARDKSNELLVNIACQPEIQAPILDIIMENSAAASHTLATLASHLNASEGLLDKIASIKKKSGDWSREDLVECVAENPKTSVSTLRKIAKDKSPRVRFAVAGHPSLPQSALEELRQDKETTKDGRPVYAGVAKNPNAPAQWLRELAKDKHAAELVAKNPSAPPETLEELARSKKARVRFMLAQNPRVSAAILAQLATDPDDEVRVCVALHASTPVETQRSLFLDTYDQVRRALALNRSLPEDLANALALDSAFTSSALIDNPTLTTKTLELFSQNPDASARRRAALHINTTAELLRKLSKDIDPEVRRAARQRLTQLNTG